MTEKRPLSMTFALLYAKASVPQQRRGGATSPVCKNPCSANKGHAKERSEGLNRRHQLIKKEGPENHPKTDFLFKHLPNICCPIKLVGGIDI